MPRCPFCDHPNPAGTERCESCGAWVVQGDALKSDRVDSPKGSGLEEQIRSLLAEGRKIEAIKLYREATGVGLAEAKDAVEALDEQGGPSTSRRDDEVDLDQELLSLLGRGEKIQAIRVYREQTGVGLKEAKDAVEALGRRHGIVVKEVGCAALFIVSLVLGGVALTVAGAGLACFWA